MDRKLGMKAVVTGIALAALMSLSATAMAKTITTGGLTVVYTTPGALTINMTKSNTVVLVSIAGGGTRDMLNIKSSTAGKPVEVVSDGSFANLATKVRLQSVVAKGQIKRLTASGVSVDSLKALELGSVSMTSKLPVETVIETSGTASGKVKANINLSGVTLRGMTIPNQTVTNVTVSAKKYGKDTLVKAGIVGETSYDSLNGVTSYTVFSAKELLKIAAKGCDISTASISTAGSATKTTTVEANGQLFSLTSGKSFVGGAIEAGAIVCGGKKLVVSAKGGDVDANLVDAENELSSISSKMMVFNNGSKVAKGGVIGDIQVTTSPVWADQMLIVSGGLGATKSAAVKPTGKDIKLVSGDLGVYAGMYANVDDATSPSLPTINGNIFKIKTLSKIPTGVSRADVSEIKVQGVAASANPITYSPKTVNKVVEEIIGTWK